MKFVAVEESFEMGDMPLSLNFTIDCFDGDEMLGEVFVKNLRIEYENDNGEVVFELGYKPDTLKENENDVINFIVGWFKEQE